MLKSILAITLSVMAFQSHAQVEIVDRPIAKNGAYGISEANQQHSSIDANFQSELYFQLQMLQQEVQELRGLVEEQSFELKKLKQQRLDDYLDLDRRLSQAGQAGQVKQSERAPSINTPVRTITNTSPNAAPVADELASYRAAIDLVLKKRDFDGGAAALHKYLEQFPEGHYVANGQYWLGQIYLQKQEFEQSKKWFGKMIEQFPRHQKAGEAKFKLAKVLHQLGDSAQAKLLLQEVVNSNSSAAPLAKDFLNSIK